MRRVFDVLGRAYGEPIFLITRGADGLAIHSTQAGDAEGVRRAARAQGLGRTSIHRHGARDLVSPRDLATMVARLTKGREIAHDPVGGVLLAQRIVGFTRTLRGQIGQQLRGVYFDADGGTLRVWLRPSGDAGSLADVGKVMRAAEAQALDLRLSVSALIPRGPSVPVDGSSAGALRQARMRRRLSQRLAPLAALVGLATSPAAAQDMKIEGSIGASGGVIDGDAFGQGVAQIGAVGDIYVQADIGGLVSEGISGGGVGGQIGYVDPDRFRAGVFGYGWKLEDYKGTKFGAYGELYLDSVTFRLEGGRIDGELDDADTYGKARLSYYVSDNTKLFAEGGTLDDGWGGAGVEHAFAAMPGLVAGVSGRFGNDEETAKLYVRWYFGGPDRTGSLKQMDRSGLAAPMFDEYEMRRTVKRARAASYGGGGGGGPVGPVDI